MAEKRTAEGWDGVDDFIGAGDLTLLSDDGESVLFLVVGTPVATTSKKFGTTSKRAMLPILTVDGLSVIPLGARTYRKISRQRKALADRAVLLTRHGAAGDTGTVYEVQLVDVPVELAEARKGVTGPDVGETLKAALEILAQAR